MTYTDGQLKRSQTQDADGNLTYAYIGGISGRKILDVQVAKNGSTSLNTAYVYDDLGRLKFVIPPKVYALGGTITPTSTTYSMLYETIYDSRGRVVEAKRPDAGYTYMVYNELGQAIEWAGEGRAVELRDWLDAQPALPATALDALRAALARYDLQSVETLLRNLRGN